MKSCICCSPDQPAAESTFSVQDDPVVLIQLSRKAPAFAQHRPSTLSAYRANAGILCVSKPLIAIPTPPVKPMVPSTTSTLRWVRLLSLDSRTNRWMVPDD